MKKLISFILLFLITVVFLFTKYKTPYLTVIGPINMGEGLGRQSVELIDALYDDLTIRCFPTSHVNLRDVPLRVHSLISKHFYKKDVGRVLFFEETVLWHNRKAEKILKKLGPKRDHQIRIAYSMGESSLIPPSAADTLNSYFDLVAVPDPFLIEVYQNSGVTIPIFLLPLGLQLDPYLNHPLKESAHHPFRFFNLSTCVPRKNHDALIRAFHLAFNNDPDVELRMNAHHHWDGAFEESQALIHELGATNIIFTDEKLSQKEYVDLMTEGDVLVLLSKGEGFSIQPREAMALGLPAILSDNTAHTTILQSGLAFGIACPQEIPYFNSSLNCPSGTFFLADIEEAAKAMRALYQNYQAELPKAEARREWARKYNFSQIKPLYQNIIAPKTINLGEKNEISEEGVTTSCPRLYHKYEKLTMGREKPKKKAMGCIHPSLAR